MANKEDVTLLLKHSKTNNIRGWNEWRRNIDGLSNDKIVQIHTVTMRSVDLSEADLRNTYLSGADLHGAYLRGAYLNGAYLRGAGLRGAGLRGAYLSEADLRGADLREADLSGADLSGADLRRAYLSGAYLHGADLRNADLRDADLNGADLRDADLSGTYLHEADLRGADLSGADLSGVFFIDIIGYNPSEIPKELKLQTSTQRIEKLENDLKNITNKGGKEEKKLKNQLNAEKAQNEKLKKEIEKLQSAKKLTEETIIDTFKALDTLNEYVKKEIILLKVLWYVYFGIAIAMFGLLIAIGIIGFLTRSSPEDVLELIWRIIPSALFLSMFASFLTQANRTRKNIQNLGDKTRNLGVLKGFFSAYNVLEDKRSEKMQLYKDNITRIIEKLDFNKPLLLSNANEETEVKTILEDLKTVLKDLQNQVLPHSTDGRASKK